MSYYMAKLSDSLYIGESGKTLGDLLLGGVLTKSFDNTTSVDITSAGGWGITVVFCALYGVVLHFQGSNNTPSVITFYGTPDFTTSASGNTVTLNDLHNWDHYIFMGSKVITNIE